MLFDYKNDEYLEFRHHEKIIQIMKDLDIPTIDITNELLEEYAEKPMAFFPFGISNGHYNESGYKITAKRILNDIQKYEEIN